MQLIGNCHKAQIEWMSLQDCMCSNLQWFDGVSSGMQMQPVFIIFCVPLAASPVTLGILSLCIWFQSVFMFCWPVALCVQIKPHPKLIQEFLKSMWPLLRRAKRGTRSVGFFTKGSPRVLVGPRFFSKCSFFLKMFNFSSKCSFFSQKVQVAKERAKTKVKGRMPKKNKTFSKCSIKCSILFSKCSIWFSKCSIVFSKCSIVFSKCPIFFSQKHVSFQRNQKKNSKYPRLFSKCCQMFQKNSNIIQISPGLILKY